MNFRSVSLGETFYQSGFEAENEPFGGYSVKSSDIKFAVGGGVSSKCAHRGKQSVTPGPGRGKYGAAGIFEMLAKPFDGDNIWIEYWFRCEDDKPEGGYKAFLYMYGNIEGKEKNKAPIGTIVFNSTKTVANSTKNIPFDLGTDWHHVKINLKYKTQTFDLFIDEKPLFDIHFLNSGANVDVRTLGKLLLGGAASPDKLTYYDDLYIGSDEPPAGEVRSNQAPLNLSDENTPPFASVNRARAPPAIDGKLDDACWLNASCLAPFLGAAGDYGKHQQSQAYCAYDEQNVYIAFKCFDTYLDPVLNQLQSIKGKLQDRDASVFAEDSVEIFLAPDPDRRNRYYQIAVNCAGAIWDSAPETGVSWNGALEVGADRNGKSWNLEIKIPLKSLKVNHSLSGRTWAVNFCRNKSSPKERTAWAPTFGAFHNHQRFGMLKFAENAPVIKSLDLPATLSEGNNSIPFSITSEKAVNLSFENKISYENADKVVTAVRKQISPGGIVKVDDNFTVYTDTSARRSSRSCGIVYRVMDADTGEKHHSSAEFQYPVEKYSPFRTSFISHASGVYFVYTKDLYIANNSSLFRNLLIQQADNIAGKFKECRLVIDLPEGLTLMRPGVRRREPAQTEWPEDAVKKTVVEVDGKKRNSYILTIPTDLTYRMKNMGGGKNRYASQIDLIFRCKTDDPLPLAETVAYYTQAEVGGQTIKEAPVRIPLHILPPINGKRPGKYLLISSFSGYNALIPHLIANREKLDACLGNILQAGFNVFSVFGGSKHYTDEVITEVRSRGLKIEKAYFPAYYNSRRVEGLFPDATEYLKKYPQHKAVFGDGSELNDVVSLSHLLDPGGEYRALAEKRLGEVARSCDIVLSDHEVPVVGKQAISFSAADLDDFRKYASINEKVTREAVQSQYKKQWNDFQCWRYAQRALLVRTLLKKGNPNCLFNVYSGYQHDPPHYGTDWRLMAEAIDYAECGYGRPAGVLEETIKAITPKKLIPSELIAVSAGDIGYNFDNVRLNLFRRLTDGNGGLMVFYAPLVDGRFWTAAGDISRLVAEFEPIFLEHARDDSLVEILSGASKEDVVVLRNAEGARLIFLFNDAAAKKAFKLKILKPLSSARLRDYYEGKDYGNPSDVSVEVKSLDVKVLVYN